MTQFNEFKPQIEFRFTITSNNDDLLSFWEPGAPPFLNRKEALILAYKVAYEPVVVAVTVPVEGNTPIH